MNVCRLVLLSVLLLGGVVRCAAAQGMARASLPVPSGPYGIGRQAFDLVDSQRVDERSGDPTKHRELMVYVWYPARQRTVPVRGEYVADAGKLDQVARAAMLDEFGDTWAPIVSGAITSHAMKDAPAATDRKSYPVVLFSHGSSSSTFSYTAQIEDLVSHGYVVVAIEHTEAAGAVLFPDGHVRLYLEPTAPKLGDPMKEMIASGMEGTQTGAEDLRFVLDVLARREIPLAGMMDLVHVGAVGHSYGGTLTTRACQLDARFRACLSEDGSVNPVGVFLDYPDGAKLKQPFALIEIDHPTPTNEQLGHMGETRAGYDAYLAHRELQLRSCVHGSYLMTVNRANMGHASFSDGMVLSAVPGSAQAAAAPGNLQLMDTLERSFLDKYLKGEAVPLLQVAGQAPAGVRIEPLGR